MHWDKDPASAAVSPGHVLLGCPSLLQWPARSWGWSLAAALGLGEQSDIVGVNWLKAVALNLSQRFWLRWGKVFSFFCLSPWRWQWVLSIHAKLMSGSAKLITKQCSDCAACPWGAGVP